MPIDEPAAAQREDLHGRAIVRGGDPDHVDRADRALVGGLPLRQVPDREQPVAVARRLLEPMRLGGRVHLLLELAQDRPRLAREELDHTVDDRAVVVLRDVADARGQAALDVVVEARDPGVAARLRPLARPVGEDAVQDVERLAHLLRVRVRAEVDDAAAVPLPREHDPWVLVLDGHGDVRIGLVVAEPDVERRPVAADQVLLEVERLGLGLGHDHLEPLDAGDHPVESEPRVACAEVRADAGAERLRLADVEDVVARAAEEVHAGLRGQTGELRLDALLPCFGGCGHVPGA